MTVKNTAGARPGTATNTKGKVRVNEILEVAAGILVNEGYGEFTMRKIAAKANMKHGNLQYYFPSKQALLVSMLEAEMSRYQTSMANRVTGRKSTAKQRLIFAVDYILKDQKNRRSCALFWELWALSSHEPEVQAVMNEFYDAYLDGLSDLFVEINPALSKVAALKTGVLAVSLLEGLSLFRGHNRPDRTYMRGIETRIRAHILALIETP